LIDLCQQEDRTMAEKVVTYDEVQYEDNEGNIRFFDLVFAGEVTSHQTAAVYGLDPNDGQAPGDPEYSSDVELVEVYERDEDGGRVEVPEGTTLFATLKRKFGNIWQLEDFE
jgi:hypothetical protein